MKCKKCGTKKANLLYYEVVFSGQFTMSIDEKGNEDVDFGGYNMTDEFIDSMLVQMKQKKTIGCDRCIDKELL